MADNDAKLPIRSLAVDNTMEVADSTGTTINPAKEDGHLATIDTSTAGAKTDLDEIKLDTDNLDVTLSTRLADTTFTGRINTQGQKTMAASTPVVIASDQSAIPVTITGTGVESPQYNTAAAVAAGASNTQSYTPGSTVNLDGFDGAASGQAKWELQYGTTGSETTKVVKFTSKGDLNVSFRFVNPVSITSAMTVKLIRTNTEPALAQDLYSTILVH